MATKNTLKHPSVGHFYEHPEAGPIYVTGGQWEVNHRTSNYWYWTVVENGEKGHGYGGNWPLLDDEYEVKFAKKVTA